MTLEERAPPIRLVRRALPGEVSWATLRHNHLYLARHKTHVTTHGLKEKDFPSHLPAWQEDVMMMLAALKEIRDATARTFPDGSTNWAWNDLSYACRYLKGGTMVPRRLPTRRVRGSGARRARTAARPHAEGRGRHS